MKLTNPTNIDWSDIWKRLNAKKDSDIGAQYWDKRSTTFGKTDTPNEYVKEFISRADLHLNDTVLDMGCGTGALALPLSDMNYHVIAADFSKGMLNTLKECLTNHKQQNIVIKTMSWDEDWAKHNITDNCVDVAIASRSIMTTDLQNALLKLTAVAKRHVCITLATGASPKTNEQIIESIGYDNVAWHDHAIAINILINLGYYPEVSYIVSPRKNTYQSFDEAYEKNCKMLKRSLSYNENIDMDDAYKKLQAYLEKDLVKNPNAGKLDDHSMPEGKYMLKTLQQVKWAFIKWDVN